MLIPQTSFACTTRDFYKELVAVLGISLDMC